MLPTRQQFILCEALDHSRRAASRSRSSSSIVEVDCEELTDTGDLCAQHAIDMLGLAVKPSTIEGAGLGLFTTRPRRRGEYICAYLGRIMSREDFELAPDAYSVQSYGGKMLSARYSTDGFGRYANDGRSNTVNNCVLLTEAKFVRMYGQARARTREKGAICMAARRSIPAGAELFVSYGDDYWQKMATFRA